MFNSCLKLIANNDKKTRKSYDEEWCRSIFDLPYFLQYGVRFFVKADEMSKLPLNQIVNCFECQIEISSSA